MGPGGATTGEHHLVQPAVFPAWVQGQQTALALRIAGCRRPAQAGQLLSTRWLDTEQDHYPWDQAHYREKKERWMSVTRTFCLAERLGQRRDFQMAMVGQCFIVTMTLDVYGAPYLWSTMSTEPHFSGWFLPL